MDFSTHPTFPGNQASITGKYHPPLQSSSQHPLSHQLLQGTTSSGGCYNDSTNALSLLSTQPWGPRTRSTSLGTTHYLGTNMAHPPINHGTTIGPFVYNHAMHEMPPDLGHGQNSHGAINEFAGELGLGQPNEMQFHELVHSRGYDASLQHMNWSL